MQNHLGDRKTGLAHKPRISLYILALGTVLMMIVLEGHRLKQSLSLPPGIAPASQASNSPAGTLPPSAVEDTVASPGGISGEGRPAMETGAFDSALAQNSQMSLQDLEKLLQETGLDRSDRQKVLSALVEDGSPEAVEIMKRALKTASEELRADIAEALGESSGAETKKVLLGLLADESEFVVRAAIRGLARQDSAEAVQVLAQYLYDPQGSLDVRVEAASGLARMKQTAAMETLTQAATAMSDSDFAGEILNALGTKDFSETKDFFLNYLRSPNVPSDLRVSAVEALAQAGGDPTEFLTSLLMDLDSDVRVAAAWALGATEKQADTSMTLMARLQSERDPDVRLRLYQALRNQDVVDAGPIIQLIAFEQDSNARVAGLDLIARAVRDNPTRESQTYFDQTGVAMLKDAALNGESSDERMAAVVALARAGTAVSLNALQEVASQTTDARVKQAATGIVPGTTK